MGTLYKRGSTWWMGYRGPDSRWVYESTGFKDRRLAEQTLEKMEAAVEKGAKVAVAPKTLAAYALVWSEERGNRTNDDKIWTSKQELGRLTNHVLPFSIGTKTLGSMNLTDLRPNHIRALVKHLKKPSKNMAPRTVRNTYGVLHRLLEDARAEELIETNPCVLLSGDMPSITDKDPEWRNDAEYTREEVEQLIGDARIPFNRRVWWAIGFLCGMRPGEIAALRWKQYDDREAPLGRIEVVQSYNGVHKQMKRTKTKRTRDVPVHPALAALLARWRETGWKAFLGREPKPEDLVVTNEDGRPLGDSSTKHTRPRDLKKLGLRVRRFHDARSTFITLGSADGGEEVWLERVTHNAKGSQFSQYRRSNWKKLCEAVLCLRIEGPLKPKPAPVLHSSLQQPEQTMQTIEKTDFVAVRSEGFEPPTNHSTENHPRVVAGVSRSEESVEARSKGVDCRTVGSRSDLGPRLRALVARYKGGGR